MGKRAIYSCITLQKELENTIKKIGFDGKVTYLMLRCTAIRRRCMRRCKGLLMKIQKQRR